MPFITFKKFLLFSDYLLLADQSLSTTILRVPAMSPDSGWEDDTDEDEEVPFVYPELSPGLRRDEPRASSGAGTRIPHPFGPPLSILMPRCKMAVQVL